MKIWTRLSQPTKPSDRQSPVQQGDNPPAPRGLGLGGGAMVEGSLSLHGFRAPAPPPSAGQRMRGVFSRRPYTWSVLLPTVLAAIYFFALAAPQYVSESRYVVRGRTQASTSLLGEALNNAGFRAAPDEAIAMKEYLLSHDAVAALRQQMDVVGIFRRPEADLWARMWYANPEVERLVDYYRSMVTAYVDSTSGITTLSVRSFRPQDSLEMNRALLGQGEALVNRLNQRIVQDTVENARRELARAEQRVSAATQAISDFRERERQLDPSRSATIAVDTIGRLEGQIATTRGELQALQAFARPNNPQVLNLQNRINALQTQVAEERRRTSTVGTEGFTEQVAAFERLRLEAEFGGRQLTAATANLERAMSDAQRQQLFLQRVVEPNLAERYRYPKRFTSVLYVFVGLSVVYGLVWLMVAGVKEHAA